MPRLAELQERWRNQLLGWPPPSSGPDAGYERFEPEGRMAIHRNNVIHSLTESLGRLFPVIKRLVGGEFFAATAREFVRAQPPGSPVLLDYGDAFPAFLRDFEPAAGLAYLPDVAGLELAWHQVYHGPDAAPLSIARLSEIPTDTLPIVRLGLHPAHRLVRSSYPIEQIWRSNQPEIETPPTIELGGPDCCLFLVRPHQEVRLIDLGPAAFAFTKALGDGATLGRAFEAARRADAAFDVQAALHRLAVEQAFVTVEMG